MFGRKGQAFDTFKLMIAAVIAVAVLGILMGILANVQTPAGSPEQVFQQMMSECARSPSAVKTSEVVNIRGNTLDEIHFDKALQSAGIAQAQLVCSNAAFTSLITCQTAVSNDPWIKLSINANFNTKFSVDCNAATGSFPKVTLISP